MPFSYQLHPSMTIDEMRQVMLDAALYLGRLDPTTSVYDDEAVTAVTVIEHLQPAIEAANIAELYDPVSNGPVAATSLVGGDFGVPGNLGGPGLRWANQVLTSDHRRAIETRAFGTWDVPPAFSTDITPIPRNPARVIDLIVNRRGITGTNRFEYLQHTTNTNSAAWVADGGTKPAGVKSLTEVIDRLRVLAEYSEYFPKRWFDDWGSWFYNWLSEQLYQDLLDKLEAAVIAGSGTGEEPRGIRNSVGLRTQAFATNWMTSLANGRATMESNFELPGIKPAWLINPNDWKTVLLEREGAGTGQFLNTDRIFDPYPKIITTSQPAGFVTLGDFAHVGIVYSGVMQFIWDPYSRQAQNEYRVLAEGRYNVEVKRPQAFIDIDIVTP